MEWLWFGIYIMACLCEDDLRMTHTGASSQLSVCPAGYVTEESQLNASKRVHLPGAGNPSR